MFKGSSNSENEYNLCRNIPFNVLQKPSMEAAQVATVLNTMKLPPQENGGIEPDFNEQIPAGYTYLGQFMVHDLITDRILPTLRLESLYGGGSDQNPKLYVRFEAELPEKQWKGYHKLGLPKALKLFEDVMLRVNRLDFAYDVPREEENVARNGKAAPDMGNASNDRNFIISQIHCAFVRFHNAVVAWLAQNDSSLQNDALFQKAQNIVTWHYQWVIVHEYLSMLVGEDLVKNLLNDPSQFRIYKTEFTPRLMPEFSKAVLRMGHSQIREIYVFPLLPHETATAFRRNKRLKLFASTAENQAYESEYAKFHQGMSAFAANLSPVQPPTPSAAQNLGDIRGGINRNNLRLDWSFFFDFTIIDSTKQAPQPSLAIDHKLASSIFDLFFLKERKSLPERDFSSSTNMPSGHHIALAYAVQYPNAGLKVLTSNEVSEAMGLPGLRVEDLPFWLYILLEAEIQYAGKRLGDLGGRILAEQVLWVLKQDENSFLNVEDPSGNHAKWTPEPSFMAWREHLNEVSTNPDIQKCCMLDILKFPDYFFEAAPF